MISGGRPKSSSTTSTASPDPVAAISAPARNGFALRRCLEPSAGRAGRSFPRPRIAFDPYVSPGLLGEPIDHRQAEPGALADRLGGEERIERLLQDVGRHANAAIVHRDRRDEILGMPSIGESPATSPFESLTFFAWRSAIRRPVASRPWR